MEAVVEARREYMFMLQECMIPEMMTTYIRMYNDTEEPFRGNRGRILEFKRVTTDIQTWNDNIIDAHVDNIKAECPWFDKLIEAVIVSLVQIMSSVKINKNNNKISLTVPSAADFVRKCYRSSQTEIYKSPDFMADEDTRETALFNKLTKSIDNVIRSYVPLQNIIAMNISTSGDSVVFEDEPEEQQDSGPEDDILMPDAAEKKIDIM
jgi:hypothetical protein